MGKGREAALVNYVWECTRAGREGADYVIACLRSNVNSDQWNGSRSIVHRPRIHSRYWYSGRPSVNRDRWKIHHADLRSDGSIDYLCQSVSRLWAKLTVERGTRERLPRLIFLRNFCSNSCHKAIPWCELTHHFWRINFRAASSRVMRSVLFNRMKEKG